MELHYFKSGLVGILLSILCSSSFALSAESEDDGHLPSKNQSLYGYITLGLARPFYSGPLRDTLDDIKNTSGVDNTAYNFDLPGIYWPINEHHTLIGPVLSFTVDKYTGRTAELTVSQYFIGASAIHFFGENIGDGFFLRGDAGLNTFQFYVDFRNSLLSSFSFSESTNTGIGILGGAGYGFPVSRGLRILVGANLMYRSASPKKSSDLFDSTTAVNITSIAITVGFLF